MAGFRPVVFAATLLCAVLVQVGANLSNDYFDFIRGADTSARLGPPRVTQLGLLPPTAVRNGAALVFGLALLCGIYLVTVGGWPVLAIGLACIGAGILYTGGPWPLAYHGLGDAAAFIFFGLLGVTGSAYLQGAGFSAQAAIDAIPIGLLITAILVVNNLRDVDSDHAAGKFTVAVAIGRRATRVEYALLLAVTYALPAARLLTGGSIWFWLPWLSAPLAIRLARTVFREEGRPLNAALVGTARLTLIYGVLEVLSIVF